MIWTTLFDLLKKFIDDCMGAGRAKEDIVAEIKKPGPVNQFFFENELRESQGISRKDWRRGKREEIMTPIYADLAARSKADIELLFDETQKPDWFALILAFVLACLFAGPVHADDAIQAKAAVAVAMAELELARAKAPVPKLTPKPTPTWIEWGNGWSKSTISGHWSHPYWGHKDRDFNWSTWTVTPEEQAECDAWMKENGHTAELPNQHFIGHMTPTAWMLKQQYQQTYSPAYQVGGYMMPMQSYGSKSRFKVFSRGGGCSAGG